MALTTVGDTLNFNIDKNTGEVIEVRNDLTFKQRENDLEKAEKAQQRALKEDKASAYNDFAQMNLKHADDWIALSKKSHIAVEILWFLIKNCDRHNALVCSSKVLEEALNYDRTSFFRALKILKESKFLDIKKSGSSNVFLINKEPTWKSWGKNQRYAEFGAKIIISESEQDQPIATKTKRVNMVDVAASRSSSEVAQS